MSDESTAPLPGSSFERKVSSVGLWLGPVLALLAGVLGYQQHMPYQQCALAGLLAFCGVYWVTEPIPPAATALCAASGAVLLGIASPKEAFSAFGKPLLFLFVGSFFIAEAMKNHGLGRRLAATLARRARGRLSMLCALSGAGFLMSMWMSNTAATAICLPIAIALARASGDPKLGTAMVLAVAYGSSVGGIATPVGTPPNMIGLGAMREAGIDIEFFHWMLVALPLATVMLAGLWLIMAWQNHIRPGQALQVGSVELLAAPGPWTRGEWSVVVALSLAVCGWVVPGLVEAFASSSDLAIWLDGHLHESVVALVAGCSLFLLPGPKGSHRPALTWSEAAQIDWGVILLFGGGIMLGELARSTGLSNTWGHALVTWTGAESTWALTALVTAVAIIMSEATSNTATSTLIVPLAVSLAIASNASPIPPALGATLGASYGFMLPISTGPNAMAYSTGMVRVPQMMRAGVAFDIVGFVVIVGGLRIMCPLTGLM